MPAKTTTTGDVGPEPRPGQGPAAAGTPPEEFPDASVQAAGDGKPADVAAEFDALVQAVATANRVTVDKRSILSVTVANGAVKVEYVDRAATSQFEPDPIRVVSARTA